MNIRCIRSSSIFIFLCTLVFCISDLIAGQTTSQLGSFQRFSSGARRQSLGNAFTAVEGDVTSVSGNPAGINDIKKITVSAFHAPLYLDVLFNSLYGVIPTRRWGTLGFGWLSVRSGEFERRDNPLDDYSLFSVEEQAVYCTYAYPLHTFLTAGFSLKTVQHRVSSFSDSSFGSDIGIIIKPPWIVNARFGYQVSNVIAPRVTLDKTEESYRLRHRYGVMYSFFNIFGKYGHNLSLSGDLEKQEYPDYRASIGAEYGWNEMLFVRTGLDAGDFSAGVGISVGNYQLDYSASAHDLGLLQKFSITFQFGYSLAEMEYIRNKKYERVTRKDAEVLSQSYTRVGLKYFDSQQYEQAIAEWEKALIWNPQNKKALSLQTEAKGLLSDLRLKKEIRDTTVLAHAYYSEKAWSKALDQWESVLRLDPSNKEAQQYIDDIKDKIAVSAEERNKYRELKDMSKTGIISQLNMKGWEYFRKGQYAEAINAWRKIFDYEYENKTALDNISQANKAIANEITRYMEKGKTFYESGLISKAVDAFNNILALEPGHPEAVRYLELCRKQALEKQRKSPPDLQRMDQLYFRAASLYFEEEYVQTLSIIDEILIADPANENALLLKEKTRSAANMINNNGSGITIHE